MENKGYYTWAIEKERRNRNMSYEALIREIKTLPESSIAEVMDFVEYVKYKQKEKNDEQVEAYIHKRKLDVFKGGLIYMADDFDDTPECFKEYM